MFLWVGVCVYGGVVGVCLKGGNALEERNKRNHTIISYLLH